jgi:hypothetical protein
MPRDCFIDKKGRIFKRESLHKAAEALPITTYHIDRDAILSEDVRWQINNFFDFLNHYNRVAEANLSIPLIVRSDGCVMDGWHRIIRALYEGLDELPQKKFSEDPVPDEI